MTLKTDFDVAFSFAGEDRDFVAQVADCLKNEGVSVFYDKSEEVTLWGKDLTVALDDIYRKKARYVVVFISAAYAKKAWTTFEKGSALAGAFSRVGQDFILPARFDDTDIPGLIPTIAYIELRNHTPQTFAELLANKIRCQEDRDIPAEAQSLTEILNAYLEKFPYRSQSDVIRALDLLDWPESVSLSMFKNAPKPAMAEEIAFWLPRLSNITHSSKQVGPQRRCARCVPVHRQARRSSPRWSSVAVRSLMSMSPDPLRTTPVICVMEREQSLRLAVPALERG